jgi:GH35 family endo-1,4-beta-xylanase
VINETIDHPATTGLRLDPVTRKLGYDFFRIAISAVKDAVPGMQVELNDFAIERRGGSAYRHYLEVGEHLDKHGLRYDRIGFQCHIDWQGGRKDFSAGNIVSAARRLSGTHVNFAITEIDVDDRNFRGDEAARRRFVAREYYDALSRISTMPRLVEVSTWSAFDKSNWIRRGDKDKGRFPDSSVSRTGWFDDNYQRTLSYYAACRALLGT